MAAKKKSAELIFALLACSKRIHSASAGTEIPIATGNNRQMIEMQKLSTSEEYQNLVASKSGIASMPSGDRLSTYCNSGCAGNGEHKFRQSNPAKVPLSMRSIRRYSRVQRDWWVHRHLYPGRIVRKVGRSDCSQEVK